MSSHDPIAPLPPPEALSSDDANGPVAATRSPSRTGEAVEVIDSVSLFKGRPTVQILHQGGLYQLRATRQGKLILTK